MTCLFCKCSTNVLEFFEHFLNLLVLKSTKYVREFNLNSKYNIFKLILCSRCSKKVLELLSIFVELTSSKT